MEYAERINSKVDEIELLTTYANGITGENDTNIGDAVRTLADGYGQLSEDTINSIADGSIASIDISATVIKNYFLYQAKKPYII